MKWNFPINKAIKCRQCGKHFEIVLANRNSTKHPCSHCGTVHIFDFDAAEKEVLQVAKAAIRRRLRQ